MLPLPSHAKRARHTNKIPGNDLAIIIYLLWPD